MLMPWADASQAAMRLVRSFVHKIVEDAPGLADVVSLTPSSGSSRHAEPVRKKGRP
jgi:hypothetical protein